MKKLLSALLSLTMVIAISSTAFAADMPITKTEETVSVNGYNFTITESTTPDYTVSRTFTRDEATTTRSTPNDDETKAMLLALGMDESEIEAIPLDTLHDYATSEEITVITSYSKRDETTNTTINLPEETALEEAAALSEEQENYAIQKSQGIPTAGEMPNDSTTPGFFKDSYMKITHSAIKQSGGSYKFTVTATWLTMPVFRGYDSIGACAMNGTVTPNTSSGKYSYTTKLFNMGSVSTSKSGDITITDISNEVNGNWYGSVGVFNLPNDVANPNTGVSIMHTDLQAYFEYKGHVSQPKVESYFNTVGTYTHTTISLGFSPSVSIDTSGSVSASIGIEPGINKDVRNAEREVHYIP